MWAYPKSCPFSRYVALCVTTSDTKNCSLISLSVDVFSENIAYYKHSSVRLHNTATVASQAARNRDGSHTTNRWQRYHSSSANLLRMLLISRDVFVVVRMQTMSLQCNWSERNKMCTCLPPASASPCVLVYLQYVSVSVCPVSARVIIFESLDLEPSF